MVWIFSDGQVPPLQKSSNNLLLSHTNGDTRPTPQTQPLERSLVGGTGRGDAGIAHDFVGLVVRSCQEAPQAERSAM